MYRIMLVEDDSAVRYVYSRMQEWGKHGFYIECEASNGSQAIGELKAHPVDIIFTDIRMPLMDGITMMRKIKENHPQMLFVLISSYNEFEYAREGLKLGALDYITKPMEEQMLSQVLERAKELLQSRDGDGMLKKLALIYGDQVNLQDPLLTQMCRFLEDRLSENITIEEVADELNLNKDYLGRQLKSKTGENFRTLYNRLKMEYAKERIKSGNQKIYEISESLGYTSSDYFTKIFKNCVGMTPADYKKSDISVFL